MLLAIFNLRHSRNRKYKDIFLFKYVCIYIQALFKLNTQIYRNVHLMQQDLGTEHIHSTTGTSSFRNRKLLKDITLSFFKWWRLHNGFDVTNKLDYNFLLRYNSFKLNTFTCVLTVSYSKVITFIIILTDKEIVT